LIILFLFCGYLIFLIKLVIIYLFIYLFCWQYIESLLRKYIVEYVQCQMCRSFNTKLTRDRYVHHLLSKLWYNPPYIYSVNQLLITYLNYSFVFYLWYVTILFLFFSASLVCISWNVKIANHPKVRKPFALATTRRPALTDVRRETRHSKYIGRETKLLFIKRILIKQNNVLLCCFKKKKHWDCD
jgi:hypothetical protein